MKLDELSGYPCIYYGGTPDKAPPTPCDPERALDKTFCSKCDLLPIYRAHIALRAAVLGDMTGKEAAKMYRAAACRSSTYDDEMDRFNALADVAETL